MSTVGIVCEYNPLHLGHLYQIDESRRILGEESTVVCVMSGDFVQRGEAAIFTKHARAEAACRSGADLVLELPLPWSISSAERFACGAVDILAAVGCSHISFGSESGDINKLMGLARYAASENIRQNIKNLYKCSAALPYAKVRQQVIERQLGDDAELLSKPNNILAVEYLKAIINKKYDLIPMTVKRIGSGHDEQGCNGPKSASELRAMNEKGESMDEFVPGPAAEIYRREKEAGRAANPLIMDTAIMSRLRMLDEDCFEALPDAANGAGKRLYKTLKEYSNVYDIAYHAATRPYPMARMRRMIVCAALGIDAECTKGSPPYIRVLAFNERGRAYLKNIQNCSIPIVTKPAVIRDLGGQAEKVFALGASAHDLFRLQFVTNDDKKAGEDWRKGPAIV